MNAIANILVALVAALHVYFLTLEMFFWTKPLGLKTFGNTPEKAADSAVLAANRADQGRRQFIMVQSPEEVPPNSAARRAGYLTISQ